MVKDSDHEGTFSGTQVDLGEDLLEQTRTLSKASVKITDDLQSAKILLGEGLIDDAKRVLRKILIGDPGNAPAKHMLNDILDRELKQLFGSGAPARRKFSSGPAAEVDLAQIDPEGLMKGLDRDLELGLFEAGPGPLTESRAGAEALASSVEVQLKGASPRDRIDIGIGFLELGMPELAAKQFQHAHRLSDPEDASSLWHSASALLAQAQILCDRAHEAVEIIQHALRSPVASYEEKLELVYLMGRANEKLRNLPAAHGWYRLVSEMDSIYRDVQDRIARTRTKAPE